MLQGAATNLLLYETAMGNVRDAVRGVRRGSVEAGARVLAAGGLADDRRRVGTMSPSEQQVVALAVAMAPEPRLLLADEPTSQLDDAARDRLLDLLVGTAEEQGTAVLVVTHDEQVARRMQRMIHLRDGRVGEEATGSGRYAVIGADGSVPLPRAVLDAGWSPADLVSVTMLADGALRVEKAAGS